VILLRLVSWHYARKHRLRSVLTLLGIVLGVGVFAGMHAAGVAVVSAFDRTVDRIAGKTQLQVTAGEAGFPEDILERVQAVPEVAVAVPVLEAVVQTQLRGQGNLLILGVDMTGDRSLRDYDVNAGEDDVVNDPLVFLAQPDSLIVTNEFARGNGLHVDSRITLDTMEGPRSFTIRGIMRSGGLTLAFGGNLAVMDIYAAQKVFGRGRRFDRVDLRLKEGCTLERGEGALRSALGPGLDIGLPATRGQQFESLLHVFSLTVNVTSIFALLIGMFIIYNTFAVAVTQRRAEIGILRALGATRGQILALFIGESAGTGFIASLLGLGFGLLIAKGLAGYISDLMVRLFGIPQTVGETALGRNLSITAVAMGTATSVVAALLPARAAASVDPVKTLQRGQSLTLSSGENRVRRMGAGVFVVFALICLALRQYPPFFYAGYLSFALAAVLLTPVLAVALSRLLRPVLRSIRPVEGALAADSLIGSPRRTSGTVAALMLSIGLIVSLGGISLSSYDTVAAWVNTVLNPDLFVSVSESLTERSFHFPDAMTPVLASVEGIAEAQRTRSNRITVRGAAVLLMAIEMDLVAARTRGQSIVSGDFDRMYALAGRGEGAIASETFSLLQHFRIGDLLEIPSPAGIVRLPIVGIVRDYTNQSGTIFIDYSVYLRNWNDPAVDMYRVYLKPGVAAAIVKERILERFSGQRRLFVFLNADVRARIMKNTDMWLSLTYMQVAIAILVAVLGIANTLTVSITDRRREFGILRAVGALGIQIRGSVWFEAAAIAIIGVVLGVAFGAIDLLYELELVRRDYAGLTLDYIFPMRLVLIVGPVILAAALISSLAASRSAARGSLVEALEYE
jgi:putative ABC transport system permease protein